MNLLENNANNKYYVKLTQKTLTQFHISSLKLTFIIYYINISFIYLRIYTLENVIFMLFVYL